MSDAMTDIRNNKNLRDEIESLRQQLAEEQADALEQARIVGMGGEREIALRQQVALLRASVTELRRQLDTAWAQAHRLALELECLLMDTKDNAIVSKWWDSAFEAIEEYNKLKPGAAEDAEVWAKMRKAGV